jgi:hypothetical protein
MLLSFILVWVRVSAFGSMSLSTLILRDSETNSSLATVRSISRLTAFSFWTQISHRVFKKPALPLSVSANINTEIFWCVFSLLARQIVFYFLK